MVVQVVQLTGVKIWLPSSQLLEDTEVGVLWLQLLLL